MDTEIVVRGSAQVLVLPDRAVVRVEVDGDGGSRDEAYRQAAPLAQRVDDVVEAHRDGIARLVTAALTVQPRTRWRRGESVRTGWRAARTSVLEVTDFARLGDLFAGLVGAGGAVAGPFWSVDATNPAYGEARRLAAEDARRRAEAYAGALGLRVTGVAWVAEPGLRAGHPDHGGPAVRSLAMAGAAEVGGEDVIDVSPDELPIDAAVEVGFAFAADAV
jgi:uncharacterized protein YggE